MSSAIESAFVQLDPLARLVMHDDRGGVPRPEDGGRGAARVLEYRQPVVDALFLVTVATVTMAKLQWEVAGTLQLSDVVTALFLVAFVWSRWEHDDPLVTRAAGVGLAGLRGISAESEIVGGTPWLSKLR